MQGMDPVTRNRCTEWERLCVAILRYTQPGVPIDPHHKVKDLIRRRDVLHSRIEGSLYS